MLEEIGKIAFLEHIDTPWGHGVLITQKGKTYLFKIGLLAGRYQKGKFLQGEVSSDDIHVGDLILFSINEKLLGMDEILCGYILSQQEYANIILKDVVKSLRQAVISFGKTETPDVIKKSSQSRH